jgi:hypothetical protein
MSANTDLNVLQKSVAIAVVCVLRVNVFVAYKLSCCLSKLRLFPSFTILNIVQPKLIY